MGGQQEGDGRIGDAGGLIAMTSVAHGSRYAAVWRH